jgi:chemotaxis-related protein WspD
MEMTNKVTVTNAKGSAADRLLDRDMPEDYLREWTQHVAAEKKSVEPGTKSVVIFRIGVEWLALPTLIFQQVAEECALHKMPGRGREILSGLVNIHGELVLCVSLEKVLGLGTEAEGNKKTGRTIYQRLMVCNRNGDRLAFPVQEIHGLALYHPRDLRELPSTLSKSAAKYTLGVLPWEGRTVGCLDDELLFYALIKGLS